ncbi:hypothetical protein [Chryseobacterium viscerum]|uniref:Uncharacterized protein n=1 Tax=Chryseobacterium viscerum TaxID=1037377 RepID=A0A316WUJ2_9FLAO|nr:hypothetical protein [Chryseobacterium viscerum]PWN64116.1 hypothetical protein C1634_005855 [Chryseobacterium viscerum]
MKLSEKPTEYLMLQAKTDSELYDCNYAIVQITENWKEEMQTRLNAIIPFSITKNDLSTMDYFATVYFYKDDSNIDSMDLLGDQHWSFVIPSKKDIKFLSNNENRRFGNMLEIQKNGWASYSTHRLQDDEYWTKEFSIQKIIDHLNRKDIKH